MKVIHLVSALSLSVPVVAFAQPGTETPENPNAVDQQVAAPSNAFEISGSGRLLDRRETPALRLR